ncbi:hypothetical protein [uncultured Limnobacter sp.]|uniref:hypothetical protein n=1 Tax=uncultured Limnobacter sp. TaxID=199681 RepID=UPI0032B1E242
MDEQKNDRPDGMVVRKSFINNFIPASHSDGCVSDFRFDGKLHTEQTMRITNNKEKIISFPEYIQDNTHFYKGTRGNFFFFGVACNYGDGEQSTEFVIDQDSTLYQRFIDTLASLGDVQEAVTKSVVTSDSE